MMDPWIQKAEHALRTDQPRLAELYMRRGLAESPAGRLWLTGHDLSRALRGFVRALGITLEPWQDALMTDYALAGPSRGSTGVLP